jgi:hypothetical protein
MRIAARVLEKAGLEPFRGDAHAFLVWVYQNPDIELSERRQASRRGFFWTAIARAEDNWGLHRHQFSKGIDRFISA